MYGNTEESGLRKVNRNRRNHLYPIDHLFWQGIANILMKLGVLCLYGLLEQGLLGQIDIASFDDRLANLRRTTALQRSLLTSAGRPTDRRRLRSFELLQKALHVAGFEY